MLALRDVGAVGYVYSLIVIALRSKLIQHHGFVTVAIRKIDI